jgi:hypothetical protein
MTAQQHTRDLDNFRDALSELRTGGGISEEFAQWYGQVMACLDAITSEFPICASLCDELRSLKYEPLPEMEDAIPEGLPREQVLAQSRRVFFRNQCDKAVELLRTIRWSLNAAAQPAGKCQRICKPRQSRPGGDKRLLRHILGLLEIVHQRQRRAEDQVLVSSRQLDEGLHVTPTGSADKQFQFHRLFPRACHLP